MIYHIRHIFFKVCAYYTKKSVFTKQVDCSCRSLQSRNYYQDIFCNLDIKIIRFYSLCIVACENAVFYMCILIFIIQIEHTTTPLGKILLRLSIFLFVLSFGTGYTWIAQFPLKELKFMTIQEFPNEKYPTPPLQIIFFFYFI